MMQSILRLARMAERYCERVDREARTYESAQLIVAARQFCRCVEVYMEWARMEIKP